MLWSKQFYHLDGEALARRRSRPADAAAAALARAQRPVDAPLQRRRRLHADKWEYPWYAAWDLAFHTIALAPIDPDFAKSQLILFCASGTCTQRQIPAYEWAFGDVNPPVHAWAVWRVYKIDRRVTGVATARFWRKRSRSSCSTSRGG